MSNHRTCSNGEWIAATAISMRAVRARLWLHSRELGMRDDAALLWLHLADGRLLAFSLPARGLNDDALIAPLAKAIADDARGVLLEIPLAGDTRAVPLYAAPAAPLPDHAWGHPKHAEARAFASSLDQGILECIARLDTHRYWSSARNYTRLAAGETGERRLQAVARFPVLAAPILLTAHHAPDFEGGKRHAWRNHNDAVVEAVEHGRDLTGALAAHYGISRGLVRAPACSRMWGNTGIAHTRLLKLLDRIPTHARPMLAAELERAAPYLAALERLIGAEALAAVSGRLFRPGWHTLWAQLEAHHAPLANSIDDVRDFLRVAVARIEDRDGLPADEAELGHAWLDRFGLASLLKASRRWHERARRAPAGDYPDRAIPAIFGTLEEAGCIARELLDYGALSVEGEAMHHCVASYWDDLLENGTRIVALRLDNGQRATAEYEMQPLPPSHDAHFRLVQLRGPCNDEVRREMRQFARGVEHRLNAPEYRAARAALIVWLGSDALLARFPAIARLDPESERQLAEVLRHHRESLCRAPPDGTLLCAPVAGYAHYRDGDLENGFAPGQPLELAREPNNPHDPLAVRIDWQGRKVGYVPRPFNADIARLLDAGEQLACRIWRFKPADEPWTQLECTIAKEIA